MIPYGRAPYELEANIKSILKKEDMGVKSGFMWLKTEKSDWLM